MCISLYLYLARHFDCSSRSENMSDDLNVEELIRWEDELRQQGVFMGKFLIKSCVAVSCCILLL